MVSKVYQKTALVTGARSGVGYALATKLLREGWMVLAVVRSELPDTDPIVAESRAQDRLRTYRVDLSDADAVLDVAARIRARESHVDWLVNCAALSLEGPSAARSGRDVHFEVNVLAPYLLTTELLPLVRASEAKVILQVSSNALLHVKTFSIDELVAPSRFVKLFGPYAASKLALSAWTRELAPSLPDVRMVSACPGANDTPMTRGAGMPAWLRVFVPFFFRTPARGAARLHDVATRVSAGASTSEGYPSGAFIVDGRVTPVPHADQGAAVLARLRAIAETERAGAVGGQAKRVARGADA